MSENTIEKNVQYKSKYLKYKLKYLELRKKIGLDGLDGLDGFDVLDSEGGGTWDTLGKSALSFARTNPKLAAGIVGTIGSIGTIGSNIQNIPNLSSGVENVILTEFKRYFMISPQYQQLVQAGLMTPENQAIMYELVKLEISHLADPSFYPIMFELIKNILILAGSTETFNPITVLAVLKNLYRILNTMKIKYPRDFILLSSFLRTNKDKIFYALRSQGMIYPGMEMQYNMFMNLIEPNQHMIQQQSI